MEEHSLSMEAFFEKEIGRRIDPQKDLQSQINECDLVYERMMHAQKHEEVRMSMRLEQLKVQQQSQQEIEKKQMELDQMRVRHEGIIESLSQMRNQLQSKLESQEVIFEQQK